MTQSTQSVPDLVADAKANAAPLEARIAAGGDATEVAEATAALEAAAVDVFSAFEARMQHHFKRGPFSRKLKSLLLDARKADLAKRLHQYYLAVNVLKHGKGASHRELLEMPSALFEVKHFDDAHADVSLVDISKPGFFDGLTGTILEAYEFLEKR